MTSYTTNKPTRMQAWLTVRKVCKDKPSACFTEQTDMAAHILDTMLGEGSARYLLKQNDKYISTLQASKLTLCPSGNNPEQYRIWEAIVAGSIPVVEQPLMETGHFFHPKYPLEWACLPR